MPIPVYPKELTDAAWQKQKGLIAKAAGETGVGAALKKAETLYKAIKWERFDPFMGPKLGTFDELEEAFDAARKEYAAKVEPLRKALFDARDKAEAAAKTFKSNKLIPADARKATDTIIKSAERFAVELKSMDDKPFEDYRAQIQKVIELANKNLLTSVNKLDAGLRKVAVNPTVAEWEDSVKQNCRSVCNCVRALPDLNKRFWKDWQSQDGFQTKDIRAGSPDEAQRVKEAGAHLFKLLKELRSAVS